MATKNKDGYAARKFKLAGKPFTQGEKVSLPADQFDGFERAGMVTTTKKEATTAPTASE